MIIKLKPSAIGTVDCNQRYSLLNQLRQFQKNEDGSLIAFSLYLFIIMLIIGGVAVDVMRAEYQRAKIQYTEDRAVLAAAGLTQTISAQEIMDDYFEKAGMGSVSPTVVVETSDNFRKVSAYYPAGTSPYIYTMFMRWVGVDTLPTPAFAAAEDAVSKVEISLVLDVSGSMRYNSVSGNRKIDDLKVAAKQFFDTLMTDAPEPDTYSISVVPYSTQVSAGAKLLSKYTVTAEHGYSHCVDFFDADFNSAAISTGGMLQRTGHFAPWSSSSTRPVSWSGAACIPKAGSVNRDILTLSTDINDLKNYIDSFEPSGWTSTEIGVKWGAALLDPSARPAIADLIGEGEVSPLAADRPYNYNETGIMKVIVVMSDGDNTNQYLLDPKVASGMSPVWKYTEWGKTRYVIYNSGKSGANKYLHTDLDKTFGDWKSAPDPGAAQMTFPELWNHASMWYVSKYMFKPAGLPYSNWNAKGWDGVYSFIDPNVTTGGTALKDARMSDICSATKAKDVIIFAIGFEVSDSNAVKLANCATTEGHFFRVDGANISDAFASIAAQLHNLRLTQ